MAVLLASALVPPAGAAEPTDWFHEAQWGVMTHYLGAPPSSKGGAELTAETWNKQVDAFDVAGFVDQLASTGAKYLLFTIGQNSGHYCSPNATYDRIVGITPSKCSRRDLIADLAKALAARNIRLMVYLPSGAPAADPVARQKLGWRWGEPGGWQLPGEPVGGRLAEFQRNWEAVIREWSLRWGKSVSGWWIDGCYFADQMYRFDDEPNFASFARALKAGNPEAIVAFNPGVKRAGHLPHQVRRLHRGRSEPSPTRQGRRHLSRPLAGVRGAQGAVPHSDLPGHDMVPGRPAATSRRADCGLHPEDRRQGRRGDVRRADPEQRPHPAAVRRAASGPSARP